MHMKQIRNDPVNPDLPKITSDLLSDMIEERPTREVLEPSPIPSEINFQYNTEKLHEAFEYYKKMRDLKGLPYTFESLCAELKIPTRIFKKMFVETSGDFKLLVEYISDEVMSSMIDHAIINKCSISKWLITVRDRETYSEAQKLDIDGQININIRRV